MAEPSIMWFRRDLRLSDNRALRAAVAAGGPVICVFIHDECVDRLGTAPAWRLGLGVGALQAQLEEKGSTLVLRRGAAREVLEALVAETGATSIHWSRAYDPESQERDRGVKTWAKEAGLAAQSHVGHLLFEPWTVETKTGGFYKVYTPMWKAVRDSDLPAPDRAPSATNFCKNSWLSEKGVKSDKLEEWGLGSGMRRGADIVRPHVRLGEDAARNRLHYFCDALIGRYDTARDEVFADGTSNLSESLSLGEISPLTCWHAGLEARDAGKAGAETFLKELVWREFAYHLLHHTPRIATGNWREEWDSFPWNEDERISEVIAWKRGRTGIPFVDAAMREMYVTGRMHNRGRMIVASYLCKHLLCHWKIGKDWFDNHLIDWDPASNAMGWQWSAGSGPDATPYFRVFNPVTQREKFDPRREYVDKWIAEGRRSPSETALSYFDAIPKSWAMAPSDSYPEPIVAADEGRKRALHAYENRDF
ncbi:MAG: deoxyribodipyrimidine photo-lyase [Pseudomonadota bacterium]